MGSNAHILDLLSDLNISPIFNVEGLTPYYGAFESPSMSNSLPVDANTLQTPTLPQYRDDVEAILDDHLVMFATSVIQHFLIKWHDRSTFDATWITLEELT